MRGEREKATVGAIQFRLIKFGLNEERGFGGAVNSLKQTKLKPELKAREGNEIKLKN